MLAAKPFTRETMAKYFFYDANGVKQGPVSKEQLKELANQEIITPTTRIEVQNGPKGVAGQISGMFDKNMFGKSEKTGNGEIKFLLGLILIVLGGILGILIAMSQNRGIMITW